MLVNFEILDERKIGLKLAKVQKQLDGLSVVVAFSGGVDSTVLAVLAKKYAYKVQLVMQTGSSIAIGEKEIAQRLADILKLDISYIEYDEVDYSLDYTKNPDNRCYYCKKILHKFLEEYRAEGNYDVVLSGTNYSDLTGHRPGHTAVKEFNALNPLVDAELTKEEIRWIARDHGIFVWDKPAMACLASRMKTGTIITKERLNRIRDVEFLLKDKLNFKILRVRDEGDDIARIEVGVNEIPKLYESQNRTWINQTLKIHGFQKIIFDKQGYRPSLPTI